MWIGRWAGLGFRADACPGADQQDGEQLHGDRGNVSLQCYGLGVATGGVWSSERELHPGAC